MKRWTFEEDNILIEEVKLHPTNLQVAFKIAACRIQRTQTAVSLRWYRVLRKENNFIYGVFSDKSYSMNIKNGEGKLTKKKSIFNRIKKLLGIIDV